MFCTSYVLGLIAVAAVDLAFSQSVVPNACLKDALRYNFQSSLLSASNASKMIHYRAEVFLHCRGSSPAAGKQLPQTRYMLWFKTLETSITDYVPKTSVQGRRRKLPPNMVRAPDPENPTKEQIQASADDGYKSDEDSNSTIGRWFPLPSGPVLFDRLLNGTITSITFSKADSEQSRLISIKRAIVFFFQTAYPIQSDNSFSAMRSIAEYDELGYHFTNYKFETPSAGGLLVKKTMSTDDFIEMQRDSVNNGMLTVSVSENQFFEADGGMKSYSGRIAVQMATNTHPTQVFSVDEDIKSQVAIDSKANLTLLERVARSSSVVTAQLRGASGLDWEVPEQPSDVLSLEDDPTAHIADLFSKIEPSLYAKGIETILDEFTETPKDQSILKPLLRSLQLEAELYYAGKIKTRKVFDMAMPSIKKQLTKCENMQSWSLCLSFLNLAVAAGGQYADKTLIAYIRNDQLPNIYRVKLMNMAIFMSHPSDYFVNQLMFHHRAGEAFDDDELEFRNHLLLAIGSAASRITVTNRTKSAAADYLNSIVKVKFANDSCPIGTTALLSLSAAGNMLNPMVVDQVGPAALRLVNTIIRVVEQCGQVDDVAINGLAAISKLHSSKIAMTAIITYLSRADCHQKSLLVGHLMKTMHFNIKVWPARGVNDIDRHFATLLMFHPEMLSCDRQTFEDYFARKKMPFGSVAWQRSFGMIRPVTTLRTPLLNGNTRILPQPKDLAGTSNSTALEREKRASGDGYSYNVYTTDWTDYNGMFVVIQAPSQFQTDKADYPTRKHLLYDVTGGTNFFSAYMRAGFFTGKNAAKSTGKLFGRLVVNIQLGIVISILDVAFMREQTQTGFYGYTRLSAIGYTYMDLPQYACNITIDQWSYAYQFALPVYTVSFGGFDLNMNADLEARATLYLWPSYCLEGDMGIMFKPYAVLAGNAFAEIANSYFGVGLNAQLFINYYLELSLRAPDGCFRLYHGNDDMSFSINIYLKLPTFSFVNVDPTPATSLIIWNVFQWNLLVKQGGKWALFGWCPPSFISGPDTPSWTFDDSIGK